jgi:hypothetical protein
MPKTAPRSAQANAMYSINVNDPGLITLVNKLQDVFTTVGVRCLSPNLRTALRHRYLSESQLMPDPGPKPYRFATNRRRRIAVLRKEFRAGKHCRQRFVSACDC